MKKNTIKALAFILITSSMQAIPTLSRIDTSLLGTPMHEVTIDENHYRTVYIAYPQESLKTLEQRKLIAGTAATLATTGVAQWGFKTAGNLLSNTASVLGNFCVKSALTLKNLVSTTQSPMPTHEPSLITVNLVRYGCYAALSAFVAHKFWKEYNTLSRVFDRLLHMNTERNSILNSESLVTYFPDHGNVGTSIFSSPVPVTYFPHTHPEITRINAENPNLIWFRASQEVLAPMLNEAIDALNNAPQPAVNPAVVEPQVNECSICYHNLDNAQTTTLPCNHTFHRGCIDVWCTQQLNCPLCRREIPNAPPANNQ